MGNPQSGSKPVEGADGSSEGPPGGSSNGDSGNGEPLTAEALRSHLAAEALLREASEERTASLLARHFKLTVALAGINLLLAGASAVMLFNRSEKVRTVVLPPASSSPATAPAQPMPTKVLPAAPTISPPLPAAPAAPLPAVLPPAVSPSLGQPPSPAPKSATMVGALRTPRALTKPQPKRAEVYAKNEDEAEAVVLSSNVERW